MRLLNDRIGFEFGALGQQATGKAVLPIHSPCAMAMRYGFRSGSSTNPSGMGLKPIGSGAFALYGGTTTAVF